jgi:PAS domain S-box-containing protein
MKEECSSKGNVPGGNVLEQTDILRSQLATLVGSVDDAIIGKTLDGVITSWNLAAERLFGYTAAEAIGKSILLIIPPERQAEEDEILERLRRGQVIDHYETERIRKDGRRVLISLTVSPIKDKHGRVVRISKVARDITERRRLEAELKKRAVTLADREQRKHEFLAALARELRNPLALIRDSVQTLHRKGLPDGELESARGTIEGQIQHLIQLADDLFDVSRAACGKANLDKKAVDLAAILLRVVEASAPLAEARGHRFMVAPLPLGVRVEGDEMRLAQIFTHIIDNAVKYSHDGARIWLSMELGDGEVAVRVKDEGIGISPQRLPQIFELFNQSDRNLERAQGGLGIGLPLVKSLANLHGGRVEAFSEGGERGSEFVVWLPLLGAEPRQAGTPALRNP